MQASLERLRRRREEEGEEGGFTLIELLIVIVILGILAAIVVFAVQNLTSSSSQASCGSDYKTVETAVEAYKAQMGAYPTGGPGPHASLQCDPRRTLLRPIHAAANCRRLCWTVVVNQRRPEPQQRISSRRRATWSAHGSRMFPRTEITTRSP